MITPKKWELLRQRMIKLNISESSLVEKFILGSGHGGQKIQKTASCVFLKHKDTGIQIKCQKSRLRESNRYFARRLLCEKIEARSNNIKSTQQQALEKIRRQKKRRSRRSKQKMLAEKKQVSEKKVLRNKPNWDD